MDKFTNFRQQDSAQTQQAQHLGRIRLVSGLLQPQAEADFSEEEAEQQRLLDPLSEGLAAQAAQPPSGVALGPVLVVSLGNLSQPSEGPPLAEDSSAEEAPHQVLVTPLPTHQLVLAPALHQLLVAALKMMELARFPSRNSQKRTLHPQTPPTSIRRLLPLTRTRIGHWKSFD